MKIEVKKETGYLLVTLEGHFDAGWASPLASKIGLALKEASGEDGLQVDLIIDLGELLYISSGGLRIFLGLQQTMKKAGRRLALCDPAPMVSAVLNAAGMYGVFQIQPSVAAAVKTLTGGNQ